MKNPKKLKPEEIDDLVKRLIDGKESHCSLSGLNKHADIIIEKTRITGEPCVLRLKNGGLGIVCDMSTYAKIEGRRRRLIELLGGNANQKNFVPRVAKRSKVLASTRSHKLSLELRNCISRVEYLRDKINWLKCMLYDREEELAEAERKLKRVSERIFSNLG